MAASNGSGKKGDQEASAMSQITIDMEKVAEQLQRLLLLNPQVIPSAIPPSKIQCAAFNQLLYRIYK